MRARKHVRQGMRMTVEKQITLIFPPLGLDQQMLDRASLLFGAIGICIPWYMDEPIGKKGNATTPVYPIFRPPEERKPSECFPKMLQEYRVWMRAHVGRSASIFLSTERENRENDESSWEIRKMVRKGVQSEAAEQQKHEILKWHLMLHLAAQLEQEQEKAEHALRQTMQFGSPLKEALGEETDGTDFLADLSPQLLRPKSEVEQVEEICYAWLGLFGERVQKAALLVTFSKEIFQFLSTLFEESISQISTIESLPHASFCMGDPCSTPSSHSILSEETDLVTETRAILRKLEKELYYKNGKGKGQERTEGFIRSLQQLFPLERGCDTLSVNMLSLPRRETLHASHEQAIFQIFSGKTVVFLEMDPPHSENAEDLPIDFPDPYGNP